jgi:nicotinate dehydrogenase subunit B
MALREDQDGLSDLEGEGLSRRDFLFGAGALVITFGVANSVISQVAGAASKPAKISAWAAPGAYYVTGGEVAAYLAITAAGKVLVSQSQPDLGTGAQTGMLQVVAEELYVPFDRVSMPPITSQSGNTGGVGGSAGVRSSGAALRLAAATAREQLRAMAAAKLGVKASELTLKDGVFSVGQKKVSYGELVHGKQLKGSVDLSARLKPVSEYTIVGTSVPRIDIPDKLTGTGGLKDYLVNQRVAGMVHARILRPPAYGATIVRYDATKTLAIKGVTDVVPIDMSAEYITGWNTGEIDNMIQGQFLAVVATDEWAAISGVTQLEQDTVWTKGTPTIPQPTSNNYEYLTKVPIYSRQVVTAKGSMPKGFAEAKTTHAASYSTPYLANAPIGPSTGMAYVQPGKVEVWSDGQDVFGTQSQVASLAGVPASAVIVHSFPGSGVYGRGWNDDAVYEATLISQAVGKPVRVQWMRQQEFEWSTMQGPKYFRLRGGLDGSAHITALQFDVYTDKDFGAGWMGQNGIAIAPNYTIDHISQVVHYGQNPMRKGLLRAVGAPSNAFAVESFVDELAFKVGMDPLQFRLHNLSDARMIRVLEAAAEKAGWRAHTKPAKSGEGMGIATFYDPGSNTYVADVAKVSVDKKTGQVSVHQIYVGFDCGLMVNPNGAKLQIEGATLQSLSWCLKESVKYSEAPMVTTVDWLSYPILHFSEVPEVIPVIVDRKDIPPGGVGELGTMPTSASVANAIYDATGARVREWPFTAANVKAAMEA